MAGIAQGMGQGRLSVPWGFRESVREVSAASRDAQLSQQHISVLGFVS